jgi:hypothetical protein
MIAFLKQLRWSALAALMLAAIGIAAAWVGDSRQQESATRHAIAQSAAIEAQRRLGSVYAERREIDNFLPRFNALGALGALGNENRLDWIERLAALREELRLPRLSYTIDPRQANPQLPAPGSGLVFESSHMKFEFELLHEGDLLRIIERLRNPAMGVFEFNKCVIARLEGTVADLPAARGAVAPLASRLGGECHLEWISLTGAKPPQPDTTPPEKVP